MAQRRVTATPSARRPRPSSAPLSERDAAAWLNADLTDLSYAEARALVRRINLGKKHPRTQQFQLTIRLLFDAPMRDARRSLLRVPFMGRRRSAEHRVNYIHLLVRWREFERDDWLNVAVASFVLRLKETEWRRMSLTNCCYLREWLIVYGLASRPAAEGIALLHRLHTMSACHEFFTGQDAWVSCCLEYWISAHAEHPVSVPASFVQQLLQSEDAQVRALAFTLLGTHALVPDLESVEAS